MTDGELRGIVLESFYKLRNQQRTCSMWLALPEFTSLESDIHRLLNICEQLGQHGLIQWKSLNSLTADGGMGKITARGVDVIEGTAHAPITVTLHDHRISVNQSSNVQIGDSNTQDVKVRINAHDLARLVTDLTKHLGELNLDPRQKQRAEAQVAVLKVELAGEEPDLAIVSQVGRTLRSITEGAISSLLATAATQPAVWQWIHHTLASF